MTFHWDLGLLGIGVLAGGVAWTAWQDRPRAGAASLSATMVCVGIWALAHFGAHHATAPLEVDLLKLQFAALAPVGFLVFAFVLAYTGHHRFLTGRGLLALLAWPGLVVVLLWLPEGVSDPLAVWPAVRAESGVVFWGHLALTYGLLAVGTGLLLDHARSAVGLFRRQALAVLAGVALAWLGSFVSVFELLGGVHLHALQVGLAGMGLCFLWGVVGTDLTRISPTARRTIIRTMEAGVLVFDDEYRITTTNPAARDLLGLPGASDVVGQSIEVVLEDHPSLAEWLLAFDATTDGRSRTFTLGDRTVTCELSPLSDERDRFVGGAVVVWDVTEQRRQREELERQNERLEQFGSTVSHDLRAPLTVAKGHLELERDERGADTEHLVTATEALDRMETLIEDLRVLAETGQSIEATERVDLREAVERAWRLVDADDATVTVDPDGRLLADPARFRQLLENLFRNSVEHGGDDVTVRVGATAEGFYVEDDGPGIPSEDRDRIFEEGYSTATEGMGLGLTIVTDVVEGHGWDIAVTDAVGGGARFEVTGLERPGGESG